MMFWLGQASLLSPAYRNRVRRTRYSGCGIHPRLSSIAFDSSHRPDRVFGFFFGDGGTPVARAAVPLELSFFIGWAPLEVVRVGGPGRIAVVLLRLHAVSGSDIPL